MLKGVENSTEDLWDGLAMSDTASKCWFLSLRWSWRWHGKVRYCQRMLIFVLAMVWEVSQEVSMLSAMTEYFCWIIFQTESQHQMQWNKLLGCRTGFIWDSRLLFEINPTIWCKFQNILSILEMLKSSHKILQDIKIYKHYNKFQQCIV